MRVVAVVLAGGTSRRFGADKLAQPVCGKPLLDHALAGLPEDWLVVVVGPERHVNRPVIFAREEPPGGGPAAGLAAGVQEAWCRDADCVVTLPGDSPDAGHAAEHLLRTLLDSDADACVAVDHDGVDQPLQLAVRGDALDTLAQLDPDLVHQASARTLLELIDAARVLMPSAWTVDIDTPEQLAIWLKS